jgi:deoxycytidylate deaminase
MKEIHKIDSQIMDYAASIAKLSDMKNKHGCVIIDSKGEIISTGMNKTNIHVNPNKFKIFNKNNKISLHAEENALRNVDPRKLKGARLYVIRLNCSPSILPRFSDSKPCKKCTCIIESCMKKYGLKVVYYSS